MLYERYAKMRFQEGREAGRVERDKEWVAWLERQEKALDEGRPFDEPPPSAKACSNGN